MATQTAHDGESATGTRVQRWVGGDENLTTAERLAAFGVVSITAVLIVMPLYWMVNMSLKSGSEATAFPPTLVPASPGIEAYVQALQSGPWLQWFLNTGLISVASTILVLTVATPAAYAVARRDFTGATLLFLLLMSTMMIPGQILLIPLFVMFSGFGLVNSYLGLILIYAVFFTGFTFFVLHGFFQTLPSNLEDAARIGGISEWKILLRIILPLTKPGLATAGVFVFVFTWNEFLFALVFMQNESMYTISVGLQQFFGLRGSVVFNELMAVSTLASIPVLVLFIVAQEQFVKGISTGGYR
jgi:ABC-type glycerol-3-phosphate transport system permease component